MMRFYTQTPSEVGGTIELGQADALHAYKVLRMKPGAQVTVFDLEEHVYDCVVTALDKNSLRAQVLALRHSSNEPTARVTVYAALSKGDRFDWLLQKCVECGARHIVPFVSEHCVAVPEPADYAKKQARFQRIALEAGRQSGRSRMTTVGEIASFRQALEQLAAQEVRLFLYEREQARGLSSLLQKAPPGAAYGVMAGPEGGFSPREAELAEGRGAEPVSIGPRILRCETAPVAALCAIMYQTGNFDIGV